jgi:hypothetical protein
MHSDGAYCRRQLHPAQALYNSSFKLALVKVSSAFHVPDGNLDSSTTSSNATTSDFAVISAASELQSFLSQSPRVLLSPTENDRFCSLLNAEINAASYEWEKHPMRELLAEVHRLKEAIASCPFSSRPETVPLQGHENLD